MAKQLHAVIWPSGELQFKQTVPAGAMAVARGTLKALRHRVAPLCRLAYDGKTMLVPGVTESRTRKHMALHDLQYEIAKREQRNPTADLELAFDPESEAIQEAKKRVESGNSIANIEMMERLSGGRA